MDVDGTNRETRLAKFDRSATLHLTPCSLVNAIGHRRIIRWIQSYGWSEMSASRSNAASVYDWPRPIALASRTAVSPEHSRGAFNCFVFRRLQAYTGGRGQCDLRR